MPDHPLPDPGAFAHRCRTVSAKATAALGEAFARRLRGGEAILLYGPLGAGKTCFVQGLCMGLGIREEVTSPTFTLVNSYAGRRIVHHLDFYRVEAGHDLADIGVEQILVEVSAGAVLVAEWPRLLAPLLPDRLELLVLPAAGEGRQDERTWHLRAVGATAAEWPGFPPLPGGSPC